MQSDSDSLSYVAPSCSTLPFDEASTTLWTHETDAEQVTDRVIWQPSQPQDPVLRQLMKDANSSRRAPCIVQTKSWSPSSSVFTNYASTSTTSTTDKRPRTYRPFKRRAPNTNVAQREASAGLCEDSLDKHIQKFVALLPVISKKVDDNVKRKEKAYRKRRREEKKARRLREDYSVVKRERTDGNGKQRADEGIHEEEELTAVEESFALSKVELGNHSHQRRCSGVLQNMSSSSVIPLRKNLSAEGTMTSQAKQCARRHPSLEDMKATPELPSFRPSSFAAASTPRPCADTNASRSPSPERADAKILETRLRVLSTNQTTVSYHATHISGTRSSQPRIYTPIPPVDVVHPSPNPIPSPTQLNPPFDGPSTTNQIPELPRPKSNGPPVLGMRRLPNSQVSCLSQNRNLPSKQDKFKVPFAKPKLEPDNIRDAGNLTRSAFVSVSSTPRDSNECRRGSSTVPAVPSSFCSSAAATMSGHEHPSGPVTQVKQASWTPSLTVHRPEKSNSTQTGDKPSLPVPADPDSSFDYDMGIDLDELEKACSMYD